MVQGQTHFIVQLHTGMLDIAHFLYFDSLWTIQNWWISGCRLAHTTSSKGCAALRSALFGSLEFCVRRLSVRLSDDSRACLCLHFNRCRFICIDVLLGDKVVWILKGHLSIGHIPAPVHEFHLLFSKFPYGVIMDKLQKSDSKTNKKKDICKKH